MKKIISLLVCVSAILSCVAFAAPYDDAESAEKILIDYFYNHKDELYQTNVGDEVEEAMLADIDNDGIPELLFSRYSYLYGLAVYKVKGGKVVEIEDKIWFGNGTGISEEISFLMDNDGFMYIYREGDYGYFVNETAEEVTTLKAIYNWSENGLTARAFLEVTNDGLTGVTEYTDDLNAANDSEVAKVQISQAEAEAKVEAFNNLVKPYVVWSENDYDKNSGLNRIWDLQKEKYAASSTSDDVNKNIVLKIGNPEMSVNGEEKEIDPGNGTVPTVINGRTLVPVRAVVEEMGGTVAWDSVNNTAILSYSGKTIKLVINSNVAYLNDVAKTLDVAPVVMNGRTMLPIRFIAESFGFDVDWRKATQQIVIVRKNTNDDNKNNQINYNLLSCIGKTKTEITEQYGKIVDSEYWLGGKYYIYNNLKSQIFYENPDDAYDYTENDDVEGSARCLHMYVNLSELFNSPNKTDYTIEELQYYFGDYEFTDDLDNDFYSLCYYKFTFGDYVINIESEQKNPIVDYVYVFNNNI